MPSTIHSNPLVTGYHKLVQKYGSPLPERLVVFNEGTTYSFSQPKDWYLLEWFYVTVIRPLKRKQVNKHLANIKSEEMRNLVESIVENAYEFINYEEKLLISACSVISRKDLAVHLRDYIPVRSLDDVVRFLLLNERKRSIVPGLAVLLSMLTEGEENNEDNEYILDTIRVLVKFCPSIDFPIQLSSIDSLITEIGLSDIHFAKRGEIQSLYPEDGDFALPWAYVRFQDGYLTLMHPRRIGLSNTEFTFPQKNSKAAYRLISPAYLSRFDKIQVRSRGFRIVQVLDSSSLSKGFSSIESDLPSLVLKDDEILSLQRSGRLEVGSMQNPVREKDSVYLEFLSGIQLSGIRILPITENLTSDSGGESTEDSFLFTVAQDEKGFIVVYENIYPARATYLFKVNRQLYQKGIEKIASFFSSETIINKRQKLTWNSRLLVDSSILWMQKIIHPTDDFSSWRKDILRFLPKKR